MLRPLVGQKRMAAGPAAQWTEAAAAALKLETMRVARNTALGTSRFHSGRK